MITFPGIKGIKKWKLLFMLLLVQVEWDTSEMWSNSLVIASMIPELTICPVPANKHPYTAKIAIKKQAVSNTYVG